MTLDRIGAWLLPWLHAGTEWAVDELLTFERYIVRWREILGV